MKPLRTDENRARDILCRYTFVDTERLPGGKYEIIVREPVARIKNEFGIIEFDICGPPISTGPLKYKEAMTIRRTAMIRHALKYLEIKNADRLAENLESSHSTMIEAVAAAMKLYM